MITFVYPAYLNSESVQNPETSNLNFMMFFGMHLNHERNGDTVICLPIPKSGLSDKLSANWKFEENTAESVAQGTNKMTSEISTGSVLANAATVTAGALGSENLVGIEAASQLKSGIDELAGNAKGDMDIPIFEKMDNREHEFSWDFTPTSIDEADLIISICNAFKIGSLPHFKPGQIMLGFPPRWNIKTRFKKYGLDFKTSVITSCVVTYGGGDSYNEFQVNEDSRRGIATKITLSVTFKEIAKPNTLLLTDPNRQRTDRGKTATQAQDDKWAEAKRHAGQAGYLSQSINSIISTGFLNAETFSGNAEKLD